MSRNDDPPPGVEQLLPRGRIAAVFEPVFVTAEQAEIADDAWVLGVAIGDEARAYSLNLLNSHEVVNDVVGGQPMAAVWCPLANAGLVYDRRVDGKEIELEASGALMQASLVMRDRQTDSWWPIMTGEALAGPLEGQPLTELQVSEKATWADWKTRYPHTTVLSVEGREHVENNPYDNYFTSEGTFRGLEIDDERLPPKTPIFAFWLDGKEWAVPHRAIEGGVMLDAGNQRVFIERATGAAIFASSHGWRVETGSDIDAARAALAQNELEPLEGFDTFWYSWVAVHAETELLP
ncbi:MAG: DUF3179 domain-containing (seleno)protein [Acidobacteriota bacterium]